MAGIGGGALAAAVTRAGGLGFIGGGDGDVSWIDEQLDIAALRADLDVARSHELLPAGDIVRAIAGPGFE